MRSGGVLEPKTPATVSAPPLGRSLAISHDGLSLYVPSFNSVLQYDVGGRGLLSPKDPAVVDLGGSAGSRAVVSPYDSNVYVSNETSDTVSQFRVTPDGGLTPLQPIAVGAGEDPDAMALSPDGAHLYVANRRDNSLFVFDVSDTGRLRRMGSAPTGGQPSGIVVVQRPTASRDVLHGTAAANVLCGLGGHDVIRGHDGDDRLYGDVCAAAASSLARFQRAPRGKDRITGGRGDDKLSGGPGADRLQGGPGGDRIDSRDGRRDVVLCGAGHDTVRADKRDRMRGCERR